MIKPTQNNVLVELDKLPDKSEMGFHLVRVVKDTRGGDMREYTSSPMLYGTIGAVGPGVLYTKIGQHVAFLQVNCWRFEKKGVLISEDSIMATI